MIKELFSITKGTKVVIVITFSVSIIALAFAFFYYRTVNRSEDPRINSARIMLMRFDRESSPEGMISAFSYLDSAAAVFKKLPDYRSSFEPGIVFNNKCSALLMNALYDTSIQETEKITLLELSMRYCDSSITVYKGWLREWETLSRDEIEMRASEMMNGSDPAFKGYDIQKLIKRRIENLLMAQVETPRRLSVSLTNRGTIFRHIQLPDSALACYRDALKLWGNNRIAKSNMSVLLGGEPEKPGLIEALFPPDRTKK